MCFATEVCFETLGRIAVSVNRAWYTLSGVFFFSSYVMGLHLYSIQTLKTQIRFGATFVAWFWWIGAFLKSLKAETHSNKCCNRWSFSYLANTKTTKLLGKSCTKICNKTPWKTWCSVMDAAWRKSRLSKYGRCRWPFSVEFFFPGVSADPLPPVLSVFLTSEQVNRFYFFPNFIICMLVMDSRYGLLNENNAFPMWPMLLSIVAWEWWPFKEKKKLSLQKRLYKLTYPILKTLLFTRTNVFKPQWIVGRALRG